MQHCIGLCGYRQPGNHGLQQREPFRPHEQMASPGLAPGERLGRLPHTGGTPSHWARMVSIASCTQTLISKGIAGLASPRMTAAKLVNAPT